MLRASWDRRDSAGIAWIRLARLTAGSSELRLRARAAYGRWCSSCSWCVRCCPRRRALGSVYVSNSGAANPSGTVSQYGIGAGGGLSPYSPATVAAGVHPLGVAVTPDGKSAGPCWRAASGIRKRLRGRECGGDRMVVSARPARALTSGATRWRREGVNPQEGVDHEHLAKEGLGLRAVVLRKRGSCGGCCVL